MNKSSLLFAVHGQDRACLNAIWPIACTDTCPGSSYEDEAGIWALWEATADPEQFADELFDGGSIDGPGLDHHNGLWVYEVEWIPPSDDSDPDDWSHLRSGEFRRPSRDEIWMFIVDGPRPDSPWKVHF